MAITLKQLTAAHAIHPGEMLKDELRERGITQKDFASLTGIQQTQLNEIIKGKRGVSAEHALLIGKVLQIEPSIWMNFQSNYELDLVKQKEKTRNRLSAIDQWHTVKEWVPVAFFKKEKLISNDPVTDIETIKNIYKVSSLDNFVGLFSNSSFILYRKSEKLSVDKINLMGWIKLVEYRAQSQKVAPFNKNLQAEIIVELKKIFAANKNTVKKTENALASFGVKLVIINNPTQCAIDGIAFWSNGSPAIGLSLRHSRIDNFAFNILHELGHIFLHLSDNPARTFIDVDTNGYGSSPEEREANEFASTALINSIEWKQFLLSNITDYSMVSFAKKQGVHPATVLGRYCYEMKKFKVRTQISKVLQ